MMKLQWPWRNQRTAKFAALMKAYAQFGRFSGAVLVAQGGQIRFQQAYGMATHEHQVPNTPKTVFGLGSLSKSFTALAILQLQEQGKVRVTDPLSTYLPDYPQAEQITLHHLLTNTSGIPDYVTTPAFERQMRLPTTVAALIALFKDRPLLMEPGAAINYSNSNWVLLGAIIEQVSGLSYGDYLAQHIFQPAGMTRSGYDRADLVIGGRAEGYQQTAGQPVRAAFVDPSAMYAAGGLYSTVTDLYRWQQALTAHNLLTPVSYAQMTASHVTAEIGAYGYGWFNDTRFDRRREGHDGGTPGFLSLAVRYPADDLSVILLANSEASAIHEIEQSLAAIALGQPYELPTGRAFVTVDPDCFSAYVGRYETHFMGRRHVLSVEQEGVHLTLEAHGLPKVTLAALTPTRYFARLKGEVELEFLPNGDGRAHEIALQWSGYPLTAKRTG